MTAEQRVLSLGVFVKSHAAAILEAWMQYQSCPADLSERQARHYCELILEGIAQTDTLEWSDPSLKVLKERLVEISQAYALHRATPSETALTMFSLKEALVALLRETITDRAVIWQTIVAYNGMIDRMGLYTIETFSARRESMIYEQQRSILELSTPVIKLWDKILALPVVGTVDTVRTQQIMESLLQMIVDTAAQVVLVDITGVPIVDTTVARHLLQTVTAARLLGAEVILVGISPRIAQTLVHLGVDLGDVTTRASMASGLELALARTRQKVVAA